MAQLPFLVVHGAIAWKVLLVGLVAATFAIGHVFRRFRARRAARWARAEWMAQLSAPKAGPIVVRGRITEGTGTSVVQALAIEDRSKSMVLDCDGERLELAGAIRVEQGSTARATLFRPALTLVQSVKAGDEVIAVGELAPAPPREEAAGYREAKPHWTLTGEPIRVLATKPRVRARPISIAQLLGALLVVPLMWFGILHYVGGKALKHADDTRARDGILPELGALEIAAAMPGSREDALSELSMQLHDYRGARTEHALQLALALDDFEGECPVQTLTDNVRLEPALAAARRCGTHKQVVELLGFLGRFDEAERELAADDVSDLATTIHIATGHWKEAAQGADARAERLAAETPDQYRTRDYLHHAASTQRCLAALLRTYGGVANAFQGITISDRECVILRAASYPLPEQAAELAALSPPNIDDRETRAGYDLAATELLYAAGGVPEYHHSEGVSALIFTFATDRVWLAPFQLAAHPEDPVAHETMVAYHALAGDLTAARAELAHVDNQYARTELTFALALREGTPIDVPAEPDHHPGLDVALALRQGVIDDHVRHQLLFENSSTILSDLERALHGDGDGLVAALQGKYTMFDAFAIPVLAVLPRITVHRDHAVAALRLFRNDLTVFSTDHLPFRALPDLILYRDIARVAGDTEDAAQWQAIIDRHVKMLRDRQKVTALLFWTD